MPPIRYASCRYWLHAATWSSWRAFGVVGWWEDQGAVFCERYDVPAGDGFTECVHVGRVDTAGTVAFIEELRTALAV